MFNLRLDRAVSLMWRPAILGLKVFQGSRLPILMYHGISEEVRKGHPYFETNTTPKVFAEQMAWLRSNRYSSITLDEAVGCLASGNQSSRETVITFDDGFLDFYTEAFPVLRQHGFTAILFVVTDWIKKGTSPSGRQIVSWQQVRSLHQQGIAIGSHSVTHNLLRDMSTFQLERELGDSKAIIEDELGAPVTSFAYPYAFPQENANFVKCFRDLLEKRGYSTCVTTSLGRAQARDDRFLLPRLPVNRWDDTALLRAKLDGAYDWLRVPQGLYKRLQHHTSTPAAPSPSTCLPS